MSHSLLKIGALAATMLVASASGVFAAQYADINYNTAMKALPKTMSANVDWAGAVDTVLVINCIPNNGGWCKVKNGGPAGWVKKAALDFYGYGPGPFPYPPYPGPYPYPSGPSACFAGPLGSVCVSP